MSFSLCDNELIDAIDDGNVIIEAAKDLMENPLRELTPSEQEFLENLLEKSSDELGLAGEIGQADTVERILEVLR